MRIHLKNMKLLKLMHINKINQHLKQPMIIKEKSILIPESLSTKFENLRTL